MLRKLHAYLKFLSPHHATRMAVLVTIENKLKGLWHWIVDLDFSSSLRKVANEALNGSTSEPDNLSALQRLYSNTVGRSAVFDNPGWPDNRQVCTLRRFHTDNVGKYEKLLI
jgi:hypothetical protein